MNNPIGRNLIVVVLLLAAIIPAVMTLDALGNQTAHQMYWAVVAPSPVYLFVAILIGAWEETQRRRW